MKKTKQVKKEGQKFAWSFVIVCFLLGGAVLLNMVSNEKQTTKKSYVTKVNYDNKEVIDDTIKIPPFEVEINLSKIAEEKIKDDKEPIIVMAHYTGIPKDETIYSEGGVVVLLEDRVWLTNKYIAKFGGAKFSKSLTDKIIDKDIDVLIDVFGGRYYLSDASLLNCDTFQNKASQIVYKKIILNCKLVGE